ncbi:MAG: hypothetical protein ACTHOP_19060 [Mesorhizobium sp.]
MSAEQIAAAIVFFSWFPARFGASDGELTGVKEVKIEVAEGVRHSGDGHHDARELTAYRAPVAKPRHSI